MTPSLIIQWLYNLYSAGFRWYTLVCFNRRIIYEKLKQAGVPVPKYAVLNRDKDGTTSESQLKYLY